MDRAGLMLATPGHGAETAFWGANASVVHTMYFGFGVLSKTVLGFAAQSTSSDPYQQLPEGIVRVTSALPNGGSAVRSLSFGGNPLHSSSAGR